MPSVILYTVVTATTSSNSTASQHESILHLLHTHLLVLSDMGLQCALIPPSSPTAVLQRVIPTSSKSADPQRVSKCLPLISRCQVGIRISTLGTLPTHFFRIHAHSPAAVFSFQYALHSDTLVYYHKLIQEQRRSGVCIFLA